MTRVPFSRTEPAVGPVVALPRTGTPPAHAPARPPNAFAILRGDYSILVDAPFAWALEAVHRLAEAELAPLALVLSHHHLAAAGDAFEAVRAEFGVTVLIHPADRDAAAAAGAGGPLGDPTSGQGAEVLREAELELVPVPGHTPGSVMLFLPGDFDGAGGGILLAGDSAVGRAPGGAGPGGVDWNGLGRDESDRAPRLARPAGADADPHFFAAWQALLERHSLAAVLPLHGEPCTRAAHPEDFDRSLSNLWLGDPVELDEPRADGRA